MKGKIFEALKTEFKSLGLGDEVLENMANVLNGMGVITDENLSTMVKAQAPFLLGVQKLNDKRAEDATQRAKAKAEEEAAKRIAEIQKQLDDAKKGAGKSSKDDKGGQNELIEALRAEFEGRFTEMATKSSEWEQKVAQLQKENDAMKQSQALASRKSFITDTAKNLGIPEWRINEGFVIEDTMDEAGIKAYLGDVASNIKKVAVPPMFGGLMSNNNKPDEAEIKSIVDKIIR